MLRAGGCAFSPHSLRSRNRLGMNRDGLHRQRGESGRRRPGLGLAASRHRQQRGQGKNRNSPVFKLEPQEQGPKTQIKKNRMKETTQDTGSAKRRCWRLGAGRARTLPQDRPLRRLGGLWAEDSHNSKFAARRRRAHRDEGVDKEGQPKPFKHQGEGDRASPRARAAIARRR